MNIDQIANSIADEADEFLAGVTSRAHARAGVAEMVTIRHSELGPADRVQVTERVMALLEKEGFFDMSAGGNPGAEAGENADE